MGESNGESAGAVPPAHGAALPAISLAASVTVGALAVCIAREAWVGVMAIGTIALFLVGLLLWWHGEGIHPNRKLDEIGRALMVSALLTGVFAGLQYFIAQQQKARDLELSLAIQSDLSGADLHGKDLSGIRLHGKNLTDANLRGANLRNANLAATRLSGADLAHADLTGANLRGAYLDQASLDDATLTGAVFKDGHGSGANFRRARLRDAEFQGADLREACFARADLREAVLAGADLSGAVLTAADARGTKFEDDLRPARLRKAGLAHLRQDRTTVWPLDYEPESVRQASGLATFPVTAGPREDGAIRARVLDVVDGDTLRLQAMPADQDVLPAPGRAELIGVDARDPGQPGAREARRFLQQRLRNHPWVEVRVGRTVPVANDRTLVYIWDANGRESINEAMLESGWADLNLRRNPERAPAFEAAEIRAKQRGAGLWRDCPDNRPR